MRKRKHEKKRTKNVVFRMTETEYDYLKFNAERTGLSPSEFLRRLVMGKRLVYKNPVIHNDEKVIEALNSVSKVGGLLNQIARYYNSGGVETEAIRNELQDVINCIRSACMKLTRAIEAEYGST